jgi:hypothetical protein
MHSNLYPNQGYSARYSWDAMIAQAQEVRHGHDPVHPLIFVP